MCQISAPWALNTALPTATHIMGATFELPRFARLQLLRRGRPQLELPEIPQPEPMSGTARVQDLQGSRTGPLGSSMLGRGAGPVSLFAEAFGIGPALQHHDIRDRRQRPN